MCELTDEDTVARKDGIIALQLHAGPPMKVQFRNILLKRLKMKDTKKVVFIAGRPSHGYAQHEHRAGCLLLAKCLSEGVAGVKTVVLFFEIMLVAAVVVITWFALYAVYRLITDEL